MSSIVTPTETDETDDSEEYFSLDSDMEDYMTSDAVYTDRSTKLSKHITSQDLPTISNSLDKNDKVSLIYLLYDDPHTALQQIFKILLNESVDILNEWYCYEIKKHNTKWDDTLLEALIITQNYRILRMLGFKREEIIIAYQPMHDISLHVNIIRKCCYRICEDFNIKMTRNFLQTIEQDFIRRKKDYLPRDNEFYDEQFLEMYFLYLETDKFMSLTDLQNLAKIFKQMDMDNLHDKFLDFHQKFRNLHNKGLNIDKTPGLLKSEEVAIEKVLIRDDNADMGDVYKIDPEKPGLLLIINNIYFYTEFREDFKNLLPKTDLKLETRNGSQSDEKKLIETFFKRGFEIRSEQNKTHEDLLLIIRDTVKDFDHSSLIVAILSHGDEGIVYGANSIAVPVTKIQNMMCQKHLSGKPKILLLQSCQGNDCQKIDDEDLEVDGPSKKYIPPKTTDMLIFRATIPGFGAVRHKKEGSWFIQVLCKMVEQNPNEHIAEICRKVILEVSAKQWNDKCMVPLIETTFTKRLYYRVTQ